MRFEDLLSRIHSNRADNFIVPQRLLALDPGETTGYAVFENGMLTTIGHRKLGMTDNKKTLDFEPVVELISDYFPNIVVCENYRIYAWKVNQHTWADLITPKLIGAITYRCSYMNLPLVFQAAQEAKGFVTDKKLKEWAYYYKGSHARDAIRHGAYYLLFNKGGMDVQNVVRGGNEVGQ